MTVQEFKFKWGPHLNGWELNLLLCQQLTDNWNYPLLDLEKIGQIKDKILEDLKALDLSQIVFQDLYEETFQSFYQNGGGKMGEFYTPDSIKTLYLRIARVYPNYGKWQKVYDPTSGTGGLLNYIPDKEVYMGTEIRKEVSYLANMFLRYNKPNKSIYIAHGSALERVLKTKADLVVANPPFGIKWEGKGEGLDYGGVYAPKSKADYAFIKHMINSVEDDGLVITLCYPSILWREAAEAKIRGWLLEQNMFEAVIQLPDNTFTHTSISTCLIVLRKNRRQRRVFFADMRHCVKKIEKLNVMTQEALDELIHQFEQFQAGGEMPALTKKRKKEGLPLIKAVDVDELLADETHNLDAGIHTMIEEVDEYPYNPEIDDSYATVTALKYFQLSLQLNQLLKYDYNGNPRDTTEINDLVEKELETAFTEFMAKYKDKIDEIIKKRKELDELRKEDD